MGRAPWEEPGRLHDKLVELGYGVEEPPDEDDDYETLITW